MPGPNIAPGVVQQVDRREFSLPVQEPRSHAGWCFRCQRLSDVPLLTKIESSGLARPELTTPIAYLQGAYHASFSTIRTLLRELVRVTISQGQLARIPLAR